jgi:hypothetical protein
VVIYDLDFPLTPTLSRSGEREFKIREPNRKIATGLAPLAMTIFTMSGIGIRIRDLSCIFFLQPESRCPMPEALAAEGCRDKKAREAVTRPSRAFSIS